MESNKNGTKNGPRGSVKKKKVKGVLVLLEMRGDMVERDGQRKNNPLSLTEDWQEGGGSWRWKKKKTAFSQITISRLPLTIREALQPK